MFDNYTLKARVYPIIILCLPVIIIGIFYSFQFETLYLLLSSLGIVGALMYLFSQLGRDRGKIKENKLWETWGGPPTTQMLRLKNERLDELTKKRYHQKLLSICPPTVTPDITMEENNPEKADEVYRAWTKYLISKTRDTKTFNLLFKDNISYGFRRNLWGLKIYGIILTIMLLLCNYFFWVNRLQKYNPFSLPENFIYSSIVLLIILLFWLFIVNRSWVRIPAFSYAERLCEAVESL